MKIYFGDNQFLGVNHSDGKGIKYLDQYATPDDIAATLRDAWAVGIRDFCFTVNQKTIDAICIVIEECPFHLHPALPYAHRVNELISEKGLAGALFSKTIDAGVLNLTIAGVKSLFGSYDHLFRILIATELKGIPMENVQSIGLLNVAADFLLGIKRYDLLKSFCRSVQGSFDKKPLFYTMNFPSMADAIWGSGFEDCTIVFNYNATGFRTNPSINHVRDYIIKYKHCDSVAMSIFSGGSIQSASDLLNDAPDIKGILFGTSKKRNMTDNLNLFSAKTHT
jgi:hypothetical protein